jgi:hypothetical protein
VGNGDTFVQRRNDTDADSSVFDDSQAAFADAVNVAAFFLTNSCTLSGSCPVSMSTSSDIRS